MNLLDLSDVDRLVSKKINVALANHPTTPYLVGQPVPCFVQNPSNDPIVADSGWWFLNGLVWSGGTIGRASSPTATLKDDRLQFLFLKWGGTQAQWDSGTAIDFPEIKGRFILSAGQGSGLTNRAIGERKGEERHAPTLAEESLHDHGGGNHGHWLKVHRTDNFHGIGVGNVPNMLLYENMGPVNVDAHLSGNIIIPQGGNQSFNVMNPYIALPVFIFLGFLA